MENRTVCNDRLQEYMKEVKLLQSYDEVQDLITLATQGKWSYRIFLSEWLKREYERRIEARVRQRIRWAGFPQLKYLQEIVREELPEDARIVLPQLETLDFIREGRNIVLYGSPGTGKTHIATALGIEACRNGYSVYFTSVPHLKTYYFLLLIENKGLTKIVSLTGNDLETSRLLYSAMFCTNHKNAFLICKSSVFLPYCQSYSSEK